MSKEFDDLFKTIEDNARTKEFDTLFKMIEKIVAVQAEASESSDNLLTLVESIMEHCIAACDGKCGESHGV
jgi:hypothetical protein